MSFKQEIQEKYKDLFENSHYFVFVYTLDGNIVDINATCLNALGYSYEEAVNTRFAKFISGEYLEQAFQSLKTLKVIGKFSSANVYKVIRKDGTYLFAELLGIPLKKENQIYAVLAIGHDVTALREAEEKLAESEEKFRTMAEQSQIGIVILQDNIIKYSNQKFAEISGYTIDEMKAWKSGEMYDIVHPDDKQRVMEQAIKKQQGANDVIDHYDFKGLRKNGQDQWLELHSTTIQYENNPADLVLLIDATQRKEIEEKIKIAYQRENFYKDLFAHDMNNILQNLMISLDLVEFKQDRKNIHQKYSEFFMSLRHQINRAASLVKNVVTFSEIDKEDYKLESVDVIKVIRDVIKIPEKSKEGKSVIVNLKTDHNSFIIQADEFLINVFENLINNSIKHNNNLEVIISILITTLQQVNKKFLKIEIKDNGKGIPDSKKNSIFIRGFQEDRSVSGMGLGLSLVRAILDRYHSEIHVENNDSNDITKGSNFILLFPVEAE